MNKINKRIKKLKGILNLSASIFSLKFTGINTSLLQSQIKSLKINSLHIGCGNLILPSPWLNIHLDYKEHYGTILSKNNKLVLNYNLLKPWPIEQNSIKFIAAAHFIEHLDLNDGMRFVKNCFLSMQTGGFIRLSCPDLEIYATAYLSKNKSFFENPLIREACTFKSASTFGQIFAAKAYDSGGAHKWFYDFESLKHILSSAGFMNIQKVKRTESNIPLINDIELPQREIETVYVEAQKV